MTLENDLDMFFTYFKFSVERVETILSLAHKKRNKNYYLDAYILSCCYLDALRAFSGKSFTKFLQYYPDTKYKTFFSKISCWFLDHPLLDGKGKVDGQIIKLNENDIKGIRSDLYNSNKDYGKIMEKEIVIEEAIKKTNCSREKLEKFTYGEYFYKWYRCFLVHKVQAGMSAMGSKTEPYYESKDNVVIIPINFVIETLKSAIINFKEEVMKKKIKDKKYKNKFEFFKNEFCPNDPFIENILKYATRAKI